ncbi:hypothetical protein [Modestobacter roseus]|uniref:Uncharacterized protein n=1 Tax=Modestobacter roseus TaxID=1181884 RepID=A0A562ITR0_9ACTN|nr:hypothetical protein [Modestobacter roseus]MQA34834.1 hypothetical protein [Modestobacter roseus]TWH74065.1 hypothetical protein JD78_02598 [Modestobacter roseus]
MSGEESNAAGRRRPRAEGLLGGAARPAAPKPVRERPPAPRAVRWAALVVAVEAAGLIALALLLLFLTVAGDPDSVSRALAEVVYVGLGAGLLSAAAVGLWRVSGWSRGPVIVLQLLLGVIGYTAAFQADQPLLGVPLLALVGLELYLLATPEARLAFLDR